MHIAPVHVGFCETLDRSCGYRIRDNVVSREHFHFRISPLDPLGCTRLPEIQKLLFTFHAHLSFLFELLSHVQHVVTVLRACLLSSCVRWLENLNMTFDEEHRHVQQSAS